METLGKVMAGEAEEGRKGTNGAEKREGEKVPVDISHTFPMSLK